MSVISGANASVEVISKVAERLACQPLAPFIIQFDHRPTYARCMDIAAVCCYAYDNPHTYACTRKRACARAHTHPMATSSPVSLHTEPAAGTQTLHSSSRCCCLSMLETGR